MLAFVLGGGSSRGALQVGALNALAEWNIFPDMVVGCSIGAINAVTLADNPSSEFLDELERLYIETKFGDVFTGGPEVLSNVFKEEGIYSNQGLREILEENISSRRFGDLRIPAYTIATDLETGKEVVFGDDPDDSVIEGTLSSAALLPLYKPQEVNGRLLGDGSFNITLPIEVAIERGATTIVAFNIISKLMPTDMLNSPIKLFLHSIDLLLHSQVNLMVDKMTVPEGVTLHVVNLESPEYVPLYEMNKMEGMIQAGHYAIERKLVNELSEFAQKYGEETSYKEKGFVILNPVSGDGDPSLIREPLERLLEPEAFRIYETVESDSPTQLARHAAEVGYGWVAVAGGDGTVSAVADGLIGTDTPLYIIPAGTANAIAQGVGVPNDIEAACELIASEDKMIKQLDAIKIEDKYYLLQVGIGIESATMQNTPRRFKQLAGVFAYVTTAIKEAAEWEAQPYTLKVDGKTYDIEAAELVIANLADVGVMDLKWHEEIRPDDGKLDIVIVRAKNILDYGKVLTALTEGKTVSSDYIEFLTAEEEIEITMSQEKPVHGDGEVLEDVLPLRASVAKGVVPVFVPSE